MALTANEIIHSARDRHPAFDRAKVPEGTALRLLSTIAREVHGIVTRLKPSAAMADDVIPLPLADFEAGIPLTGNRTVRALTLRHANQTVADVPLISWERRLDPDGPSHAAWILNDHLYLRGPASQWRNGAELSIAYIARLDPLAIVNEPLPLPDEAEALLIALLAKQFAMRAAPDAYTVFATEAASAEDRLRSELARPVRFVVRDVRGRRGY